MKNLLLIVFTVLFLACESEFDPNTNTEAIPVVYCLLDLNDSIQEVRLSKTFSPNSGTFDQSKIELELWDESADIYVEEENTLGESNIYFFSPSTQSAAQDTGIFESPSFELFTSTFKPKPNTVYHLYVFLKESGIHCFANTTTVSSPRIIDPAPIPGRKISFSQYDDYQIHFYPSKNSAYHELYFQFDSWNFEKIVFQEPKDQATFVSFSSERFFNQIPSNGDFENSEFHLISYGQEMAFYINLFRNNGGPWENQTYSSFLNGVGLFSSRIHQRISNLKLSPITLELLQNDFQFISKNPDDVEQLRQNGIFEFNFSMPPSSLPTDKTHRLELSLAYSADSLYKKQFFATSNVVDSRDQYRFLLPPGNYYYQAGITCSCLADSCLWDGYPDGQFGVRYASNRFTILKGQVTAERPSFQ